jgi:hypothetical protein
VIDKDCNLQPVGGTENVVQHFNGSQFFLRRLLNPRAIPIVTYVSLFARRADMLRFPYRNYPDGSNSDNFMMLCLALCGDVSVSSRKMYYRVYEESAGLRTPFTKLLESCCAYERDAVAAIHGRLSLFNTFLFRILIRTRNTSMMAARLFHMYRKRMGSTEFSASIGRLIRYFFVASGGSPDAP